LDAMDLTLPIVYSKSTEMQDAVNKWMVATHGDLTGKPISNPLPMGYSIGCTDGSPIDVAGAHGTFRTYSYVCSLSITPR
jgi:hypothetical protein